MSVGSNVGCYKMCSSPVIGQCHGHPEGCGRFYCNTHSKDKLCDDCSKNKENDIYLEEIIQDYFNTAESIKKPIGILTTITLTFLVGWFMGGIIVVIAHNIFGSSHPMFFLITGSVVLGIIIWGIYTYNERKSNHAKDLITAKNGRPFFEDFYNDWIKEQNSERRRKFIRALLATGNSIEVYKQSSMLREVNRAVKKINQR